MLKYLLFLSLLSRSCSLCSLSEKSSFYFYIQTALVPSSSCRSLSRTQRSLTIHILIYLRVAFTLAMLCCVCVCICIWKAFYEALLILMSLSLSLSNIMIRVEQEPRAVKAIKRERTVYWEKTEKEFWKLSKLKCCPSSNIMRESIKNLLRERKRWGEQEKSAEGKNIIRKKIKWEKKHIISVRSDICQVLQT
jgi:hypothetical protein